MMEKEQILAYLKEMKGQFEEKGIDKIALFGSFAKDRANRLSDIDVAIQLKKDYLNEHDVWEYFRLIDSLKKSLFLRFSKKVDVYDLDSDNDIKRRIEEELIYV